jgi:thioredoxin-like negative regulator of GroEL
MVERMASNGEKDNQLNREELLQLGIQTARAGNRQSARVMLQQVLNEDPRNERALLWMAALARDKTEKRRYLTQCLRTNPRSITARRELEKMAHKQEASHNRALIYGGIVIGVLILVAILVIVVLVVVVPSLAAVPTLVV